MHNNWNVYKKGSKRQIIRNGQHISNQVEQYRWTISSWCCTVRSPNTDTVINSDCKSNALLPVWRLTTDSSTSRVLEPCSHHPRAPNITQSWHRRERPPRARAKSMSGTRSTPPCRWTLMGGWDGCVTQNDSQRHIVWMFLMPMLGPT
jgi:hypothetical protein